MSMLLLILFWLVMVAMVFWLVMVAKPEKLQQQLILNIPIELHGKSGVPNVIDFTIVSPIKIEFPLFPPNFVKF